MKAQTKGLFAVILILLLTGCMQNVYVPVMRPADITIPGHIKTIALIDRTEAENKAINIIEGVLTGEGVGLDSEGAKNALAGIHEILDGSPRYTTVITNRKYKGGKFGNNFPPPLSWSDIDEICDHFQSDAVLSVENFDSDFIVTHATEQREQKDKEGNVRKVRVFKAHGVARVNIGFRLYDPANRAIADQSRFTQNGAWDAEGRNARDAIGHLIARKDAVLNVSYDAGRDYGQRIAPSWYRVTREFYKRPKKNTDFVTGVRRAQVNDWDGAGEAWSRAMSDNNPKTAGRATYNYAIIQEIKGNLDKAREYAMQAYTDYGIKKARDYARKLEYRIRQEERVRMQMEQ